MNMKLRGDHCMCTACGEFFNSTYSFTLHRYGPYAPVTEPDTRRCRSREEMLTRGWEKNPTGFWTTGKRAAEVVAARQAGEILADPAPE